MICFYLITIFLCAFALARVYFLMFEGEQSSLKIACSRIFIVGVLIVVLMLIFGGEIKSYFGKFVYFIMPEKFLALLPEQFFVQFFVVVFGVYTAFVLYVLQDKMFMKIKENLLNKNNLIYKFSYECFYLDKLCDFCQKLFISFCKLFRCIENAIVAVSSVGYVACGLVGSLFKKFADVKFQTVILIFVVGLLLLMFISGVSYILEFFMEA